MKSQALSAWDMFTRETLQNSWDARDRSSHEDGVTFAVDFDRLSLDQQRILDTKVFGSEYEGIPRLKKLFQSRRINALTVSDSGTVGLRGPSSANSAVDGPTDFNAFIRNIGRSDTKVMAGGTYGFGKGVFFITSEVDTIVVYTRTVDEFGNRVNRLIAMANADDFTSNGISYTGRHWWGVREISKSNETDITEYAEPYTGPEADAIAGVLGLDRYFSDDRPTGTSIMVLQPEMTTETSEDAELEIMRRISASLTRWAWPHMLDIDTGMDPIEFKVSYEGNPLKIIQPKEDPALTRFVDAYLRALAEKPNHVNTWESDFRGRIARVASMHPRKDLGTLAVVDLHDPIPKEKTVIDVDISSHIATIRNPRMVVEYYSAPTSDTGRPYCGVFIADNEADTVFARSEPAAHHQWNHETVKYDHELLERFWGKRSKTNPVSVFFTRLKDLTRSQSTLRGKSSNTKHFKAITSLSESLGALLSNAEGGTSNRASLVQRSKPTSAKRRISVNKPQGSSSLVNLARADNGVVAMYQVALKAPSTALPLFCRPKIRVASDKGDLLDALESNGQELPFIIEVHLDKPDSVSDPSISSPSFEFIHEQTMAEETLFIEVFQPKGTAVALSFDFQSAEEAEVSGGPK